MSEKMSLVGQIIVIGKEEVVGKNNTRKLTFVINTGGKYPDKVQFSLMGDRCDALRDFGVNDVVEVFFNVRGREWKEKFYVDLQAWRVVSAENVRGDGADKGAEDDNMPF